MEGLIAVVCLAWFILCIIGLNVDGESCTGATLIVLFINALFAACALYSIVVYALNSLD